MRATMTDRRKVKDDTSEPFLDDTKKVEKMNLRVYLMRRFSWKKSLIVCVTIFLVYKLVASFQSNEVTIDSPPSQIVDEPDWPFRYNPQGASESSLNEMLELIRKRQSLSDESSEQGVKFDPNDIDNRKKIYESKASLKFKNGKFQLDGKDIQIISGAMHYFRVFPEYWEDRMKKMKACGLNTLETYVSWNLHEKSPEKYDFSGILDLRRYIQLAQKNDLYVLLRPGPYICSEWDFGGLPAWLLKDENMKIRSNYKAYQQAVDRYFKKLLPLVKDLQYAEGGPIIAFQIENEFGSFSSEIEHLLYLKNTFLKYGINEMFFTSDGGKGWIHEAPFYDEALPTLNFKNYFGDGINGNYLFQLIKSLSPDFPVFVMEFWTGWFDHWEKDRAYDSASNFAANLQQILKAGASINLYMFHGGTNFGFMSGANWFNKTGYKSDVTSYDYFAPLSEAGDITPKYMLLRTLIQEYVRKPSGMPDLPDIPPNQPKAEYGEVIIDRYLTLEDIITPIIPESAKSPIPMEYLNIQNRIGQNHGFILYRTLIGYGTVLRFNKPVQDRVQVLLNGIEVCLFTWHSRFWHCELPSRKMSDENMLDILVENHGRVNYELKRFGRMNKERKGIEGQVMFDDKPIENWKIYPLEFKEDYVNEIAQSSQWKPFVNSKNKLGLYEGKLTINATPLDTFINLKGWDKGVVFVNGFNLGRYWKEGPQKTLYVPAPVLKTGKNKIVVFELHKAYHSVKFQKVHDLGDRIF